MAPLRNMPDLIKLIRAALLLSGVMLLEHLGWNEAAELVTKGMEKAIIGKKVTYDLARMMENATEVKCSEFAKEIVKNFR